MIYLQLFFSFLQIGLFSFGGGYAAMPLIQGQVVTLHGWLTISEFTDLITISSQMTPGPIAVNSAICCGSAEISAACSGGDGCASGRDPDPEKCVLGKRRDDFPDGYGVEHRGDLRNLCVAASENETESHLGHGTGGCHEVGISAMTNVL